MNNEKIEVNKDLLEIMKKVRVDAEKSPMLFICNVFADITGLSPYKELSIKYDYPKFYNWIIYHGRKFKGVMQYRWGYPWYECKNEDKLILLDKFITRLEKEEKK
jgi:hypothetical protein